MYTTANRTRIVGLALTTAMAGALLSGCTTMAPRADLASQAPHATKAQNLALLQAEAAVRADPRNAEARTALANAYLDLGRFASAETTFTDAQALGDTAPRTALSLAVALMGQAKLAPAATLLQTWSDRIPAADSGLALALAGQPELGIAIMSNAIRAGQNDAKIRQNLAYGYAIAGRWREARLMAEQDLHGDALDQRLGQFAAMVQPDAWQVRIASLLNVPSGVSDPGQPVQLALSAAPAPVPAAAEAATQVAAAPPAAELPALAFAAAPPALELPPVAAVAAPVAEAPVAEAPLVAAQAVSAPAEQVAQAEAPALPQTFATAFLAPASAPTQVAALSQDSNKFSQDRVAKVRHAVATPPAAAGTHLVQLGSFGSEQAAKRAWKIYTAKYPELARHEMVITPAIVRGKNYWRVSAAGYGKASSASMCGRVKSGGAQCFAYAEGRPLPGAIDRGIRLASR